MIGRRNFLKFIGVAPIATQLPMAESKEIPCHEWELMENVRCGIFSTRYIGPDVTKMPKVIVNRTYGDLVLCDTCDEYYNKIQKETYSANERFGFAKTIHGYNVTEQGGSWVVPVSNHDTIEVQGRLYKPDFEKDVDTVHYVNGYLPVEVTLEIIETIYSTEREFGRIYYNIEYHECLVVEKGTTIRISPRRPLTTTLPTHPKHLCDAKSTDFKGETHKATFPEWWINQADIGVNGMDEPNT